MSFSQHSQPRYGGCESFFVQSDDDMYSLAERNRERARAIARVQHRQIGEDLSKLTAMEYQEDILDHMELMEVRYTSAHTFEDLLTLAVRDTTRCQLDRYPNRDSMVHAPIPSRFPD